MTMASLIAEPNKKPCLKGDAWPSSRLCPHSSHVFVSIHVPASVQAHTQKELGVHLVLRVDNLVLNNQSGAPFMEKDSPPLGSH